MCLAIPMQIKDLLDGDMATVISDGAETKISTALIKNPKPGEYVVIHAGFAIEKLDETEAKIRIDLFNELAEVNRENYAG